jgi:hypothetical protein
MRFNLGDGSMKRTTCRIALLSALFTPSLASAGNIDFNVQNQSGTKMGAFIVVDRGLGLDFLLF